MKKRLRKKLRLGEFREFGFEVECRLESGLSEDDFEKFVYQIIEEAIEKNRFQFGGGGDRNQWSGVVAKDGRGSLTEEDRDKVRIWLAARPEISDFSVGPPIDLWHAAPTGTRDREF